MSWERVRNMLAVLSPRRWRWQRFLQALPLDPDQLPRPVSQPGPRDVIISGVPRSGTTLLAAMLFQPPHAVTVMEPWDGMRLPPAELFTSLRREIDETGQLSRGKLDVPALRSERRVRWRQEGEATVPLPDLDDGYVLGVKWPAYWRYVELLPDTKFLVCVRDPFQVVNSFKKTGGRLEQGLMYDTAFNQQMHEALTAATDDIALRRVLLYVYVTERLLPFAKRDNVFIVHYGRWFDDPEGLLAEISDFLEVPLPRMPAHIRSSEESSLLDERDRALIREHALPVAEGFGYTFDDTSQSLTR